MNVAVYSGSFNPLHIGHLAVIRHLVEEVGFDCVYLIVSPKNPLKDSISAASGQERFDAATAAVNRHFCPEAGKVYVNDAATKSTSCSIPNSRSSLSWSLK